MEGSGAGHFWHAWVNKVLKELALAVVCEPEIRCFGAWREGACARPGKTIVSTWLILPVVIRSSQRLSHARLSINLLL